MPILNFNTDYAGQNDSYRPRFVKILTSDLLSEVVTAGYLNPYIKSEGLSIFPSDFIFVSSTNSGSSSTHQIYKPVFGANNQITLTVLP